MYTTLYWYNVEKDGLPEKNQTVIAWAKDGKDQTPDLMQECYYMSGGFYYGFHGNRMRGVTHWMEFPEPPEEEI